MKKIIAVSSSWDKNSNSESMLLEFLEWIKQSCPKVEINLIYLKDLYLEPYSHSTKRPLEKEVKFKKIANEIMLANGLVLASPTYNFSVTGTLKNFIDRLWFISLDYKNINIFGQPTWQFGHLKVFSLISWGTPNHLKILMFFLFPDFWLFFVMKYYWAWPTNSLFAWWLTFRSPAKDNKKLMKKCRDKWKKYWKSL